MKILHINSYTNNNYKIEKKSHVQNLNFRANRENYTLSELFQFGLEALDENSILIVTMDRDRSDYLLRYRSDCIKNPINKAYTLDITEEMAPNWSKLDSHFAIYKENNNYNIMGLGTLFGVTLYKNGEKLNFLLPKETRQLENGMEISPNRFEDFKFKFNLPKRFNTENAKKYLSYLEKPNAINQYKNIVSNTLKNI